MKNNPFSTLLIVTLSLFISNPLLFASESKHGGHDHGKADHAVAESHDGMGHTGHGGHKIHESNVDGHHFSYELIDMREQTKNMPEMKHTHHLMVYVKDGDGNVVDQGKVGYLVKGPDGERQKAMAMGMAGGFGADLDMSKPGSYEIKTKVVSGETTLMDGFSYEVK